MGTPLSMTATSSAPPNISIARNPFPSVINNLTEQVLLPAIRTDREASFQHGNTMAKHPANKTMLKSCGMFRIFLSSFTTCHLFYNE